MMIFLASLLVQDPASTFPVELGRRWIYETTLETELVVEVAERRPGDRWIIETRGLRPDDAWPALAWEEVAVGREGVSTHGKGHRGGASKSSSAYDGSDGYWILKFPLRMGATWRGHASLFAETGGKRVHVSTSCAVVCVGPEQVAIGGKWIDAVRVNWDVKGDPVSCSSSAWYAPDVGLVQGRLLLELPERRRELSWTLKRVEDDPTRTLHECGECGSRSLAAGECHEVPRKAFVPPLGKKILEAVKGLGAPDLETRQHAERELLDTGAPAAVALRRLLEETDAELRARAQRLLDALK